MTEQQKNPRDEAYVTWRAQNDNVSTVGVAFDAGWNAAIVHRGTADPRLADMAIDEGWIVETDDECTCGTGGLPGHMAGCGSIPVAPLDEVLEAHAIVNGADTARTVVTLYTVVVRHPGGSRAYLPASTETDAWARGDNILRTSSGSVIERVEVATVTSYQTIARTEVTR